MNTLSRKASIILVVAFGMCIALGLTFLDNVFDPEEMEIDELIADLIQNLVLVGAMLASAFVVFRMSQRVTSLETEAISIRRDLGAAAAEGEAWRKQSKLLMEGLSAAIKNQFDDWSLTPAESDIAGLMLKGLSTKEIAVLRETSDVTIRQQAQGVYRKSNLANRAELSAFFLEDLLDIPQSMPSRRSGESTLN